MTMNQPMSQPIESEKITIQSYPISVDNFFDNVGNPESIALGDSVDISYDIVNSIRDKIIAFLEQEGLRSAQKRAEIADIVVRAFDAQFRDDKSRLVGKPLFKDRDSYEDRPDLHGTNIVQFMRIVWKRELETGLYRADLDKVDHSAILALQSWMRKEELPPDIKLLSKHDVYSEASTEEIRAARRLVRAAERRAKNPHALSADIDLEAVRAARRLLSWSTRQRQAAARPAR